MMGRTHVVLGPAAAFAGAQAVGASLPAHAVAVACAFVTSAQTPVAVTFRRKRPRVRVSLRLGLSPDIDTCWPFRKWFDHREGTHTMVACIIAAAAVAAGAWAIAGPRVALAAAAGAFVGYAVHLIADRMTVTGLPGRPFPHLLPKGFRFYTGTPDRDRRGRCVRCRHRKERCRCGSAERWLTIVVLAALTLYLMVRVTG